MNFDDFNYKAFNPHVLIREPKDQSKQIQDLETRLLKGKSNDVKFFEKHHIKSGDLDYID